MHQVMPATRFPEIVSSVFGFVYSRIDRLVVPATVLAALSSGGGSRLSSSRTLQRISLLTTGLTPSSLVALSALGLSTPYAVAAASDSVQKRAIGDEFPVNSINSLGNIRGVVKLTNGNVVVVWGGGFQVLRGQIMNPITQQRIGPQFSLSIAGLYSNRPPFTDIGALPNGGFVIYSLLANNHQRLQFYTSNAEPTTSDLLGNLPTFPTFTQLANGNLAVVINTSHTVSSLYVYSSTNERLSTASISPVNRLRQVLGGKALPDGRVVIVGRGDLNGRTSFVAEIYDLNGQIIKNRFVITASDQTLNRFVTITPLAGGRFLLLFDETAAGQQIVRFALFDANNDMDGEIQQVNTIFGGVDSIPYAVALPDGGFTIMWASVDISGYGILAQDYTSSGSKRGEERRVNVEMEGDQKSPQGVLLDSGNLFYLWDTPPGYIRGRVLPTVPATTTTTSTTTTSTTSTSTTKPSATAASTTTPAALVEATTSGKATTTASISSQAASTSQSSVSAVQTTSEKIVATTTPHFSAITTTSQPLSTTARVVTRTLATTTALSTIARRVPPEEPTNPLIPVVVVLALLCVAAVFTALAALALLRRERQSDGTELGRLSDRRTSRSTSSSGTSYATSPSTERRRRHGGGRSASRPGRQRNEIYAGFPTLPSSTASSTLRTIEPVNSGRSSRSGARGDEPVYDILPELVEKRENALSSRSSRGAEPTASTTTTTTRVPVRVDPNG